jgi:hypothetical protein
MGRDNARFTESHNRRARFFLLGSIILLFGSMMANYLESNGLTMRLTGHPRAQLGWILFFASCLTIGYGLILAALFKRKI